MSAFDERNPNVVQQVISTVEEYMREDAWGESNDYGDDLDAYYKERYEAGREALDAVQDALHLLDSMDGITVAFHRERLREALKVLRAEVL
jgi:hypothetical protein